MRIIYCISPYYSYVKLWSECIDEVKKFSKNYKNFKTLLSTLSQNPNVSGLHFESFIIKPIRSIILLSCLFYEQYDILPDNTPILSDTSILEQENYNVDIAFIATNSLSHSYNEVKTRFKLLLHNIKDDSHIQDLHLALLTFDKYLPFTNDISLFSSSLDKTHISSKSSNLLESMINLNWRYTSKKIVILYLTDIPDSILEYSSIANEIGIDIHFIIESRNMINNDLKEAAKLCNGILLDINDLHLLSNLILENTNRSYNELQYAKSIFTLFMNSNELVDSYKNNCDNDVLCQLNKLLNYLSSDSQFPWNSSELIRVLQVLQNSPFDICKNFDILCIPQHLKTRQQTGLFDIYTGESVPLQSITINTKIIGKLAESTVTQTFITTNNNQNPEKLWNNKFIYPLHETASVTGFSIKYDGKEINGNIDTKENAKSIYNEAINNGNEAILLTQSNEKYSKIFSIDIGNLQSNTNVQISIKIIQNLSIKENYKGNKNIEKYSFIFPSLLTPDFYTPQKSKNILKSIQYPSLYHSIQIINYPWMHINSIYSPSHDSVPFIITPQTMYYSTSDEKYLKRDFHVNILYEHTTNDIDFYFITENNPILSNSQTYKGSAFELTIPIHYNNKDVSNTHHHIILVLDISQSMSESLNIIKSNILQLLSYLHTYSPFDFSFCIFSTNTECYNLGPISNTIIQDTNRYIQNIIPSGGSNITKLFQVLDSQYSELSEVLLISDGIYSNYIYNNHYNWGNKYRLFPIILGVDTQIQYLNTLSKISKGRIEILEPLLDYKLSSDIDIEFMYAYKQQIDNIFAIYIDKILIQWNIDGYNDYKQRTFDYDIKTLYSGDSLSLSRLIPPINERKFDKKDILITISGYSKDKIIYDKVIQFNLNTIPLFSQCSITSFGPICNNGFDNQLIIRQGLANTLIQKLEKHADLNKYITNKHIIEDLGISYMLSSRYTSFISTSEYINIPDNNKKQNNNKFNGIPSTGTIKNIKSISWILVIIVLLYQIIKRYR